MRFSEVDVVLTKNRFISRECNFWWNFAQVEAGGNAIYGYLESVASFLLIWYCDESVECFVFNVLFLVQYLCLNE